MSPIELKYLQKTQHHANNKKITDRFLNRLCSRINELNNNYILSKAFFKKNFIINQNEVLKHIYLFTDNILVNITFNDLILLYNEECDKTTILIDWIIISYYANKFKRRRLLSNFTNEILSFTYFLYIEGMEVEELMRSMNISKYMLNKLIQLAEELKNENLYPRNVNYTNQINEVNFINVINMC